MKLEILGFSVAPSTVEQPALGELSCGLFRVATPEEMQQAQKERELADYLTQHADDLYEPPWDALH
jgi:hypothetical protein